MSKSVANMTGRPARGHWTLFPELDLRPNRTLVRRTITRQRMIILSRMLSAAGRFFNTRTSTPTFPLASDRRRTPATSRCGQSYRSGPNCLSSDVWKKPDNFHFISRAARNDRSGRRFSNSVGSGCPSNIRYPDRRLSCCDPNINRNERFARQNRTNHVRRRAERNHRMPAGQALRPALHPNQLQFPRFFLPKRCRNG